MDHETEIDSPMDYSPEIFPAAAEATSQILLKNMDPSIFCDRDLMNTFESLLRQYDPQCRIFYFKNFSRARVDMDSISSASSAKQDLHGLCFGCGKLECYFFRDLLLGRRNSDHLELPPLEKQFLISPPVSPPVGWEPVHEGEPVIDLKLVAALAALQPGEKHELHPGAHDKNIPAIVLQPCQNDCDEARLVAESSLDVSDDEMPSRKVPKPQIIQTRRPPETFSREADWSMSS